MYLYQVPYCRLMIKLGGAMKTTTFIFFAASLTNSPKGSLTASRRRRGPGCWTLRSRRSRTRRPPRIYPPTQGTGLDEARVADLIIGSFHDKICDPSLSLDWNLCCLSIGGIMKTVPSVYTFLINTFYLSLSSLVELREPFSGNMRHLV